MSVVKETEMAPSREFDKNTVLTLVAPIPNKG